jgi:hypothetical protein
MSKFQIRPLLVAAAFLLSSPIAWPQDPETSADPGESCAYTLQSSGATWDIHGMRIPYDVSAIAWARDGAYGGTGLSTAEGLHSGGAAVAVAQTTYWFRLTHNPIPSCQPVSFDSEARLEADVSTKISGDSDDYALSAGFQAVTSQVFSAVSVAVAATNAGSPVQNAVLSLSFGLVNFTMTIPGVSVTADTVDEDRNSAFNAGSKKTEEELISLHCWTKTKVVSDGPFGGVAKSSVNSTSASASTTSSCTVHNVTGSFSRTTTEG